jgi:hypothetical protein
MILTSLRTNWHVDAVNVHLPEHCVFLWRAAGVSPLIEVAELTRYVDWSISPPGSSGTAYGRFDLVEKSGA